MKIFISQLLVFSVFFVSCSASDLSPLKELLDFQGSLGENVRLSFGGSFKDLKSDADYKYVYMAKGLAGVEIYDYSNERFPDLIASLKYPGSVERVEVLKDRLFVMTEDKVYSVDISSRRNPKKLTTTFSPNLSKSEKLVDFHLRARSEIYVVSNTGNLFNLDFVNINNDIPGSQVYSIRIQSKKISISDIEVSKGYIYLAGGKDGIIRAAWNDRNAIQFERVFRVESSLNVNFKNISVRGDRMVAGTNIGIYYLDTTKNPLFKEIKFYRSKGEITAIYLNKDGSKLYAGDSKEGYLKFISFSLFSNPIKLYDQDFESVMGFTRFKEADEERVFVYGHDELVLLKENSIKPFSRFLIINQINDIHYVSSLNRHYITTKRGENSGRIYEASLLDDRKIYGYLDTKSEAHGVNINNDGDLYVAEDYRGLTRYTDGVRRFKREFKDLNVKKILWLSDKYILIAGVRVTNNRGFVNFLKIPRPHVYTVADSLESLSTDIDLVERGSYFYISSGRRIYIYERPNYVTGYESSLAEISLTKTIKSLSIANNRLYAAHDDGFSSVSLSNKEDPEVLESLVVPGLTGAMLSARSSDLFLVGKEKISIFNISSETARKTQDIEPSFLDGEGNILKVFSIGNELFISHDTKGLLKFDYVKDVRAELDLSSNPNP